jgi:hypothetical protein
MRHFMEAFRREPDGTWLCVAPITINGPQGRVQVAEGATFVRGVDFMGIDVARLLDDHDARCYEQT